MESVNLRLANQKRSHAHHFFPNISVVDVEHANNFTAEIPSFIHLGAAPIEHLPKPYPHNSRTICTIDIKFVDIQKMLECWLWHRCMADEISVVTMNSHCTRDINVHFMCEMCTSSIPMG